MFGEFDGVLVVPQEHAEAVLLKAEEIVAAEQHVREEVRQGATPLDSLERHGHI